MKRKPFVYIASPYESENRWLMIERAEQITRITAEIFAKQSAIFPYSPIAYTYPLENIEDLSHIDWLEWDKDVLIHCDAILMVEMEGWLLSKGMQVEKNFCEENDIPVFYSTPENVIETCVLIAEYLEAA